MNQLGMFAKYWRPGSVKTRLARSLGDEPASRLYRQFVVTLLQRLQTTGDHRTLAYAPADCRSDFNEIAPPAWTLTPQSPGDLGARLRCFFEANLQRQDDRVVLIGTDSPTLPKQIIADAFDALRATPVVLGPTRDGGYYLVGAAGQTPPIFDGIAWSTPAVWQETVGRLRDAGCQYHVLRPWYDVDELSDLRQLDAELIQLEQSDPAWADLAAQVRAALVIAS